MVLFFPVTLYKAAIALRPIPASFRHSAHVPITPLDGHAYDRPFDPHTSVTYSLGVGFPSWWRGRILHYIPCSRISKRSNLCPHSSHMSLSDEIFEADLNEAFPGINLPKKAYSMKQSPDGSMFWVAGLNGGITTVIVSGSFG